LTDLSHVNLYGEIIVNSFASGNVRGFCAKKNRLHVTLRDRNSGAKSGRELFKGSKDSTSHLVWMTYWGFGFKSYDLKQGWQTCLLSRTTLSVTTE